MPDVVGNGLALAKGTLEDRGLIVIVEPVISDTASDTVLSTTPAAGAMVRTGDTVRLQVATSSTPGVDLQPYSLQGVSVDHRSGHARSPVLPTSLWRSRVVSARCSKPRARPALLLRSASGSARP